MLTINFLFVIRKVFTIVFSTRNKNSTSDLSSKLQKNETNLN